MSTGGFAQPEWSPCKRYRLDLQDAQIFRVNHYLPLNWSLRVVPDDEPVASAFDDLLRDVVVRQGTHLKEDEMEW